MPNEDVTQGQLQILKNLLEIFLINLLQTNKNTYLKPKNINSDNKKINYKSGSYRGFTWKSYADLSRQLGKNEAYVIYYINTIILLFLQYKKSKFNSRIRSTLDRNSARRRTFVRALERT